MDFSSQKNREFLILPITCTNCTRGWIQLKIKLKLELDQGEKLCKNSKILLVKWWDAQVDCPPLKNDIILFYNQWLNGLMNQTCIVKERSGSLLSSKRLTPLLEANILFFYCIWILFFYEILRFWQHRKRRKPPIIKDIIANAFISCWLSWLLLLLLWEQARKASINNKMSLFMM